MSDPQEPLLDVRGLTVRFGDRAVVENVSFTLRAGHCTGLVGASGSGKSVTSLALMRLLDERITQVDGTVTLRTQEGAVELLSLPDHAMRRYRGRHLAMVFQEPMSALDPVYTVGEQVAEAIRLHLGLGRTAAMQRVLELFREVHLPDPERLVHRYPHQLSGGQKQRVVIALALSCDPAVLICDEPTTALDVLVQREVLDLLKELRIRRRMAMLFITHDLGVVREVAQQVLVMHQGRMVEEADVDTLFRTPAHPYTQGLLACRPDPGRPLKRLPTVEEYLIATPGTPRSSQELLGREERRTHVEALLRKPPLLRVEALAKDFRGAGSTKVRVLHDITFAVHPGESLGIVGGSGSGKTTLGRAILRLIEPGGGRVWFGGDEVTALDDGAMRRLRRDMQLIFQDPYSSLNPRITVGGAILEAMRVHGIGSNDTDRRERIIALLERVGLQAAHVDRFPHQFSGGQRQRIVIARALALRPRLIICDESVAALDVSVQAQVLNLLNELKSEHGLTYLFISHDLNVVRWFCDRILVLEQGAIAELGPSDEVCEQPRAAYTRALLNAIPGRG